MTPSSRPRQPTCAACILNPLENAIVWSVDKKSGIQAKSRVNPTKPAVPGIPVRREFEYRRHGTAVLFAGLNVQGKPVIKLLLSNVLVLRAPTLGAGMYTLRVPENRAAWLAYASDNGHLWFVLRPASGAKVQNPGYITARTLVLGYKAVR